MTDTPTLSLSESLTPERRAAFYESHKLIAVVMILIVFLLPFAGLFVYGLIGAAASVLISAFGYYLTPYLTERLRFRASR
ncbi:MAG: hypothetical protein LZF60_50073 [Nitrospira sp.]|nr:hypothetical protein [Nitrospira sp.]ULA58341.1 MAG: hypothetical protein LZF60_50073 [Nitrospira sp.]